MGNASFKYFKIFTKRYRKKIMENNLNEDYCSKNKFVKGDDFNSFV